MANVLSPASSYPAALLLCALLLLAACERQTAPGQAGHLRATVLETPLPRPDTVFIDTEGERYDFRTRTEGKVTLLFFGYTHCPDICPMHMANIAAVMEDLPFHLRKNLEVLFVTVDPERDTPERVRSWLDNFSPRFRGLFVEDAATLEAIEHSLNLPNAVTLPTRGGGYDVGHGTQVFAFGPTGPARYLYPFGVRQRDWAHDLPILLGRTPGGRVPEEEKRGPRDLTISGSKAPSIEVLLAIVPAPPSDTPAALYATIRNRGPADALVSLSTPTAARSMLHTMATGDDGRVMMKHVHEVPVAARGLTQLEPGGYHGMFVGLAEPYATGTTVPITLEFQRAGPITVAAEVVEYADVEGRLAHGPDHE